MGQRILVADDEEGIVLLLKDYFELQGYEVITAGGGMEALDRIRCGPDGWKPDDLLPGEERSVRLSPGRADPHRV